jgi:hypothetical protein
MLIKAYGRFWNVDDVDWYPGQGKPFRLLGRTGTNLPGLRVADFRHQTGLYVLYSEYGPYYVGLTYTSMGKRLKDHLEDGHAAGWNRFSWFGFNKVLQAKNPDGTRKLADLALTALTSPRKAIADVEALLIEALGCPANLNNMKFKQAVAWTQVAKGGDTGYFLNKIIE